MYLGDQPDFSFISQQIFFSFSVLRPLPPVVHSGPFKILLYFLQRCTSQSSTPPRSAANTKKLFYLGRYPCQCEATKHNLINNCRKCGRIVCEQEGSGPCFFCDEMVSIQ